MPRRRREEDTVPDRARHPATAAQEASLVTQSGGVGAWGNVRTAVASPSSLRPSPRAGKLRGERPCGHVRGLPRLLRGDDS